MVLRAFVETSMAKSWDNGHGFALTLGLENVGAEFCSGRTTGAERSCCTDSRRVTTRRSFSGHGRLRRAICQRDWRSRSRL